MSSIIEGYNYDIFISYRQKDNKGDRWVSEFVEALKTELESTFKEEISVYFDINPHDGLLETHDVDASLKEKLKCLVFIPIISRTYCDPKSFAWEHEFKEFVELASKDKFGLKVKLPNGNVASRVLPIRIYDLDSDDIKQCETALGGVLRGVEFIYSEPGVNRPLKPKDSEEKNNNKNNYRNQINKVGNAIKEIIQGMKVEPVKGNTVQGIPSKEVREEKKLEVQENPFRTSKRKLLKGSIAIGILFVVAAILVYPKIFKPDNFENLRVKGKISIAVMPFKNMTKDTAKDDWQDWIQDILIASLSNSEELILRQTESVKTLIQSRGLTDYTSITPSIASAISQKLDASVFIYGSIIKEGSRIRVNAQLINSKTEEVFKSFQKEGSSDKIMPIIDTLSVMLKGYLIISKLEKEVPTIAHYSSTNSSEAYRYYIYGNNSFAKGDFPEASNWYLQAITRDSNFTAAINMLSTSYFYHGSFDRSKAWSLRNYNRRDQMPDRLKSYTNYIYSMNFETPKEEIKYLRQILEIDNQVPNDYFILGLSYNKLSQYDKAIPEFEEAFELYNKWDLKPFGNYNYTQLGFAYHQTGQYKKEKKLYKKAEQGFPNDPGIIFRQAVLALTEGDTDEANGYIEKYKSIRKDMSASEVSITSSLARMYSDADILDKAEGYYRQGLSLEPENPVRFNNLAYFLIDNDRNITEGLQLVDTALKLRPDNYNYLHTKGWGIYKLGNYKESLEILKKSWDLRREQAVYDHEAFLHLEAAKKAVANQKNN